MATTYSDVYELVLSLISSYKIDDIYVKDGEDGIETFFMPYLKIAAGELENSAGIDISDRDDICVSSMINFLMEDSLLLQSIL